MLGHPTVLNLSATALLLPTPFLAFPLRFTSGQTYTNFTFDLERAAMTGVVVMFVVEVVEVVVVVLVVVVVVVIAVKVVVEVVVVVVVVVVVIVAFNIQSLYHWCSHHE